MLRQVLRELRFHPSRFVATMIAIAISVAFMAGSSILVATENNGVQREQSARYGAADVLVSIDGGSTADLQDAGRLIASSPGVAVSEPALTSTLALKHGQASLYADAIALPVSDSLRDVRVAEGRAPVAAGELLLGRDAARTLGVGLGETLTSAFDEATYTVVGLTDQPGSLFLQSVYVAAADFARSGVDPAVGTGAWLVKAADGVGATTLARDLTDTLGQIEGAKVQTADQARADAMGDFTGSFDAFRNLLWTFAAIAAVVGMITIANTFSILLAQRRRQIGLLRAVGAAGAQVRRRFGLEAVALGVLGSVLGLLLGVGLALIGASLTGSLYWGLSLPAGELALAFAVGVLITVLAAWLPVLRGTRVRPLEALQTEPPAQAKRRAGLVRGIVCGVLIVFGLWLSVSRLGTDEALLRAIAGSALVALGVLFAAPLFVPALLRLVGGLVGRFGPTARLAADNSVRNPRRAATTATALMLAVGLIVTLQVATASIRGNVLDQIDQHRPVDIAVSSSGDVRSVPADLTDQLGRIHGVQASVVMPMTAAEVTVNDDDYGRLRVIGYDPAAATVAAGAPATIADDEVYVPQFAQVRAGQNATVKTDSATLTMRVVPSPLVDYDQVLVSQATLQRLGGTVPSAIVWLSVPDRADAVSVAAAVTELVGNQEYAMSGGVIEAASMESVLNLLLGITTALLGVAVLIALIGVSNTLGLSVLERTRESALMRALGLQARSLRLMLLVEALLLALVGVAVGIAAGIWFGWLGAEAVASALGSNAGLVVNLPQTLGMVLIAVLAAALASVLPGRRAAKASPTEALAEI